MGLEGLGGQIPAVVEAGARLQCMDDRGRGPLVQTTQGMLYWLIFRQACGGEKEEHRSPGEEWD